MQLNDKVEHFLAPLGVGDTTLLNGIPAEKVQQLATGGHHTCDGLELVATPPIIFQAVEWVIAMRRFGRRG